MPSRHQTPEILLLSTIEVNASCLVGGWDAVVVGPGPEPAVDVDGLEVGAVAALVLEVALAAARVD